MLKMSTKNSMVTLLVLQTAILLQLPNSVYGATTPQLCGTEQCQASSDCRDFAECPTCTLEPRCVSRKKFGDVDRECISGGYTEVILIEDPNNPGFLKRLNCSGPEAQTDCPDGSVCVSDGYGRGVCCKGQRPQQAQRGQQAAVVETERPGSCPSKIDCVGTSCQDDSHCPAGQICCTGCASLCVDPV
ncbi:hypothetical protein BsWGS_12046 [Bradybaena similaris]